MRARNLLERYGDSLVGQTVLTERYGEWPGGVAEVIQIEPDPGATEIVMQVRHKTAVDPITPSRYWEMGIFEHENVEILTEPGAREPLTLFEEGLAFLCLFLGWIWGCTARLLKRKA